MLFVLKSLSECTQSNLLEQSFHTSKMKLVYLYVYNIYIYIHFNKIVDIKVQPDIIRTNIAHNPATIAVLYCSNSKEVQTIYK